MFVLRDAFLHFFRFDDFSSVMDLRKLALSDQLPSKRKVVSGFGLGVGASLLVFTLVLMNNPFHFSFLNPTLQGLNATAGNSSPFYWFFPLPSAGNSPSFSSESVDLVQRKEHEGDLLEKGKNESSFNLIGGEGVVEKTHEDNVSEEEAQKVTSFSGKDMEITHEGNFSENAKNESFMSFGGEERVQEKTHVGNFSEEAEKGNSSSSVGIGTEKAHERNSDFSEKALHDKRIGEKTQEGNSSVVNGGGKVSEKTHEGIVSEKNKNASFSDKEERVIGQTHVGNPSEKGRDKTSSFHNASYVKRAGGVSGKCDIFNGRWVRDEGKPLYPAGSCPHIDKDFNCFENGRPDDDFLKWRWQPNDCDIPSLNATHFLERLTGKRLIFVGDSLNRNMWVSLVCILRHSVANKKRVHEIPVRREFKTKGYYSFRYEDYNCSVDFVKSSFLVRESSVKGRNGPQETLRLDLMDEKTRVYREADVLVFNTGHWWTHDKTSKGKDYYQEGNYVHPLLNVMEAYKKALTTWARWIDKNINAKKTRVFFRGYSVTHFSGGRWNSGGACHKETQPIFNESYLAKYPSRMRTLEHVLEYMKTPVVYLNISKLSDYRKDGHPSVYRKVYQTDQKSQDCSHWCLPGVPDTWNELLYASLVMDGQGSRTNRA